MRDVERRAPIVATLLVLSLISAAGPLRAEGETASGAGGSSVASAPGVQKLIDEQLAQIPSGEKGVNEIVESLKERLTLTPEQIEDIRPTIVDTVGQLERIRDRFEAGEITAMALVMQLQMVGQRSAVLIEPQLGEGQVAEYRAMRQEQRQQMMQAMMKNAPR